MSLPLPEDELGRLAAVRRYDVLDTPPDGTFDRITALAARLFDVPISIISIVDHDRIWFKSHHGIDAEEIGRDAGLCASAVCQLDAWVVENAEVDVRTIDNPLVAGELGLRFYVGVPLTTSDGFNLGTLNVIDVKPRAVSGGELDTLRDLAAIVMDELELRLAARQQIAERRRRALELHDDVVQGLAAAELALQAGRPEEAQRAVAGTLRSAKNVVSELLEGVGAEGRLDAGNLVRDSAAAAGRG